MLIPNYPNTKMTDGEGNITPEWQNTLTQLLTELQLNLSNEGYKLPKLDDDQITELVEIAAIGPSQAAQSNGNVFFNSTLTDADSVQILINGTLYKFNLTPI